MNKLEFKDVSGKEILLKYPELDQQVIYDITCKGLNRAMKEIRGAVVKRVIPIIKFSVKTILKDKITSWKFELDCIGSTDLIVEITCKEPLKHQFTKCLKELIYESDVPSIAVMEDPHKRDLMEAITKENVDLGCE